MNFCNENPWLCSFAVLLIVKCLNALAVWLTAPATQLEWEAIKVNAPRRAAVITLLRAWDVHPQKLARSLIVLWSGQVDEEALRISKKVS